MKPIFYSKRDSHPPNFQQVFQMLTLAYSIEALKLNLIMNLKIEYYEYLISRQ